MGLKTTSNVSLQSWTHNVPIKVAIMKTVAVLFVLSCLSLCFVNSLETHLWGHIKSRVLGTETIVADGAQSQYQIRAFSFPHVSLIYFSIFSIIVTKYYKRYSVIYTGYPWTNSFKLTFHFYFNRFQTKKTQ